MTKRTRETALRVAIVATYFMEKRVKLGNEGIMLHYDLCTQIAEKSFKTYPMTFDWETYYENNGDDFDVEIEKFAESYVQKEEIHQDKKYFN